jgi:hypothetical protein
MTCKHKWEKVAEEILPSAYEQLSLAGQRVKKAFPEDHMWRKKYVLVLQCTICGKLDKTVESNP